MMLLPCASRARARTNTSNAVSVPSRDIRSASFMDSDLFVEGNVVAQLHQPDRVANGYTLALNARSYPLAVFKTHYSNLIWRIFDELLRRRPDYRLRIHCPVRHSCSLQNAHHAGRARAAEVLRQPERVPRKLPLASLPANLLD